MRIRPWMVAAVVVALMVMGCPFGNKAEDEPPKSSLLTDHIVWETDQTIKPTAIVLHWWAGWSGNSDIGRLVRDADANESTYNPKLKSTDKHPVVGTVTVQIGVTANGKGYQLTSRLDSFARHARCANDWAIGIEIEGSGPDSAHYIGANKVQFDSVVAIVKDLMKLFGIKAESVVADNGKSGRGVVSHKQVDAECQWADGKYAGTGKTDVDDKYLKRVLDAVK